MGLQEQQAMTAAYISAMARIRTSVAQVLTDLFSSPGSWREPDADRFVERALPLILGAQQAAANLTGDYLSRVIADEAGEPYKPHQVDLDKVTGPAVRNGVDPAVVYRRPFQKVWSSLAEDNRRAEAIEAAAREAEQAAPSTDDVLERLEREQVERRARRKREAEERTTAQPRRDLSKPSEKPLTTAVERGERRARLIGLTDVELTATHTARERLAADPRIRYFRRVLTGAESCGLCILASSQRYHKKDLLPIHPNCDCVIAPILGDKDPGRLINSVTIADGATPTGETLSGVPVYGDDDLINLGHLNNEAHKAIIEEFGEMAHDARRLDYRKILIVSEHGEMGPILRVARHKFTRRQIDERDLAARGRPSPRPPRSSRS